MKKLLKTREAAELLGLSEIRMVVLRTQGKGPKFLKFETGSVRYHPDDLEAWARGKDSVPAVDSKTE